MAKAFFSMEDYPGSDSTLYKSMLSERPNSPPPAPVAATPPIALAPGQGGAFTPGPGGVGGEYRFFNAPGSKGGATLPGVTFGNTPTPTVSPPVTSAPPAVSGPSASPQDSISGRMFQSQARLAPDYNSMAANILKAKYSPSQLMAMRASPTSPEGKRYRDELKSTSIRLLEDDMRERATNRPLDVEQLRAQAGIERAQIGATSRESANQMRIEAQREIAAGNRDGAMDRIFAMAQVQKELIPLKGQQEAALMTKKAGIDAGLIEAKFQKEMAAKNIVSADTKAKLDFAREHEANLDERLKFAQTAEQENILLKEKLGVQKWIAAKESEGVKSDLLKPAEELAESMTPSSKPGPGKPAKKISPQFYQEATQVASYKNYEELKQKHPDWQTTPQQFIRAQALVKRVEEKRKEAVKRMQEDEFENIDISELPPK